METFIYSSSVLMIFYSWISTCVCLVRYLILANGWPRCRIQAMSGLRLGDPLSPVFFLLVVDALSRIISKGVVSNDLECLKIDTDNLPLCHLQLAISFSFAPKMRSHLFI